MEERLIYFDNAATVWPKPEGVYKFMDEFFRTHGVNPGRSGYDLAVEAGSLLDKTRKRLTKFFGGDEDAPERLVFGYNATDALNLAIPGLVGHGDHVITTNLEHNSVIRPVNHMVRDHGAEATYLPFNAQGFIEPDAVRKAIRPNTRVVIVNHGSNVIGTVQPIKEIGAICREHGLTFVVDTAQTAGVIPIDMEEMNIDVLAFTGHKALMGSMGIGGLSVRKHVKIRQVRSGGTGVRSADPYHLVEYPWRLEYGTPNMMGVASLWAGQDWLDAHGVANVHRQEMALARKLVDGLRTIQGVKLYCCDNLDNHLSTILMNLEGVDPANVGVMLDVDYSIATRTGLHCAPLVHKQLGTIQRDGGVRFSIGAFNTAQEVDAAIAGIADISQWAHERATKLHSALANEVHGGIAMADSIWTIGNISCVGMCKDRPGHPAMNANSYSVELSSEKERLTVEVAVTHVASQYAMDCLYGNSLNDGANVETVEQDLVRCVVEKELRDTDNGWNPRRTPWLTIDSHDVQEIVEQLASSYRPG